MKERSVEQRRVIIVCAPSDVDPANLLFSEGVEIRQDDELRFIETFGYVDVKVVTASD